MIAILHYPAEAEHHPYYFQQRPERFSQSCSSVFRDAPLRANVTFTRAPVAHFLAGPAFEIEQLIVHHPIAGKLRRRWEKVRRLFLGLE